MKSLISFVLFLYTKDNLQLLAAVFFMALLYCRKCSLSLIAEKTLKSRHRIINNRSVTISKTVSISYLISKAHYIVKMELL